MNDVELFKAFQRSPIFFIEKMWGLTPQPLKKEYQERAKVMGLKEFKVDWFEPFVRGKHITWQQWIILLAVEKSLRGAAPKRVSVKSGHGIGKDTALSWLILWYLFCFKDAQVPCTAPTSEQIHDILWKEISVWLHRMPEEIQEKYAWTVGYLRITESPETWFARARTARKENPEALAGVHGDFVFLAVDEASGVPDEIFKPAEGALTNENVLAVMLSNPRRLIGYFYDSHHSDKHNWQGLTFDSNDSPIVDKRYIERIIEKYGKDSDEYSYMVAGNFPKEDTVDNKGYVPLLIQDDLKKKTTDPEFISRPRLGIDPAGQGRNETSWVARDEFKIRVIAKEKISDGKGIAQKTLTIMDLLGIKKKDALKDVTIDSFGEGVEAVKELALVGVNVTSVNVGEVPEEEDLEEWEDEGIYLNKRAMAYTRFKRWIRSGGEFVAHPDWIKLLTIRYRRELSGKLKIMSKKEMKTLGLGSPDVPDGGMLTFVKKETSKEPKPYKQKPYQPISKYEGR